MRGVPIQLRLVAMRWFDGLSASSINSFKELTQAFGSCFITCSRVPWPLDSLLSLSMREGETLKTYSDRYCEMFNEIDDDFDDVAISQGRPTCRAWLEEVFDWETCYQCTLAYGSD